MKPNFCVTYEIVTPESAEHGDHAEIGFVAAGGWHRNERENMTLRTAMKLCYPQEDSGTGFYEVDGRQDYRTGSFETRALHVPANITASSLARVRRVLGFK